MILSSEEMIPLGQFTFSHHIKIYRSSPRLYQLDLNTTEYGFPVSHFHLQKKRRYIEHSTIKSNSRFRGRIKFCFNDDPVGNLWARR